MKEIIEHLEIMDLVKKVVNEYNNIKFSGWLYGTGPSIGQSLGHGNYNLRTEPANPTVVVSPWTHSNEFDIDRYLPHEANDDWFEVQPEPISMRNRHLINITRPIGINTIGQRLGGRSYDLRTEPANPTVMVSPWLQSSFGPDLNLTPLV